MKKQERIAMEQMTKQTLADKVNIKSNQIQITAINLDDNNATVNCFQTKKQTHKKKHRT